MYVGRYVCVFCIYLNKTYAFTSVHTWCKGSLKEVNLCGRPPASAWCLLQRGGGHASPGDCNAGSGRQGFVQAYTAYPHRSRIELKFCMWSFNMQLFQHLYLVLSNKVVFHSTLVYNVHIQLQVPVVCTKHTSETAKSSACVFQQVFEEQLSKLMP